MLSFESDYITGAHPKVLQRLIETNNEPMTGYGNDPYCTSAKEKIKAACACPHADVYFTAGGTQTNRVVIGAMLRDFEGVIAAETGHISTHEAGAIEATGHKVLTLPHKNGKLQAEDVKSCLESFYGDGNYQHMVFPGMVYISHPTEYGTLYSKEEMTALATVCHEYKIPLYVDGARLGYALCSPDSDLSLPELAELCDVFYIGGTKMGALCGEAIVFTKNNTPPQFMTVIKKHGALTAKGRLLGVQFDSLFTDGLYFEIGNHVIRMAQKLKAIFEEKGYRFYMDSPTNQQFIILENQKLEELKKQVGVSFWELYGKDHTVVRFATAWSTTEEDLERLRQLL